MEAGAGAGERLGKRPTSDRTGQDDHLLTWDSGDGTYIYRAAGWVTGDRRNLMT